jgi:hypothetical protein
MNSNNKKQNSKPRTEASSKNSNRKAKAMSPIAKLMATFYGVEQK